MNGQQRPQVSRQEQMAKTPRFADILSIAWEQHGLKRVTTAIVQFPSEENHWTTIVHATVQTDRGEFSAIGDANPENSGRLIAPHSIRFAESRAIARALRWATNAGEAVDVEMGDYPSGDEPVQSSQVTAPNERERPGPRGSVVVRSGATDVVFGYGRDGTTSSAGPTPAASHPSARPGRDPSLLDEWSRVDAARDALAGLGVQPMPMPPEDADGDALAVYVDACRKQYRSAKAKEKAQ